MNVLSIIICRIPASVHSASGGMLVRAGLVGGVSAGVRGGGVGGAGAGAGAGGGGGGSWRFKLLNSKFKFKLLY